MKKRNFLNLLALLSSCLLLPKLGSSQECPDCYTTGWHTGMVVGGTNLNFAGQMFTGARITSAKTNLKFLIEGNIYTHADLSNGSYWGLSAGVEKDWGAYQQTYTSFYAGFQQSVIEPSDEDKPMDERIYGYVMVRAGIRGFGIQASYIFNPDAPTFGFGLVFKAYAFQNVIFK